MHPSSQKKKKGPGSLTDTENKTQKKKKKCPGNLSDKENKKKPPQKKKKKQRSGQCPETARTDGQTDM
jgi:hypothetical protein